MLILYNVRPGPDTGVSSLITQIVLPSKPEYSLTTAYIRPEDNQEAGL